MLQRKPLSKWTSQDLEEWRKRLSNLILLAHEAKDRERAKRIIEDYKRGKLAFREAEKRLKELAAKAQAEA